MACFERSARIAIVLALAMVAGCATVSREQALAFGSFEVVRGPAGVLIGAPHGTGDTNTGAIAKGLARELKVPAVIAWGFTRKETGDRRINVNRPTEGAGLSPRDEPRTERGAHVWDEYRRLMLEAGGGAVPLYIELHCNDHPGTKGMIEIATTGVSAEKAARLKRIYVRARDAHAGSAPRVELGIEPIDTIYMGGGGAKAGGSLALARRAIMIELPQRLTPQFLAGKPYEKVLATFLREAIPVLQER